MTWIDDAWARCEQATPGPMHLRGSDSRHDAGLLASEIDAGGAAARGLKIDEWFWADAERGWAWDSTIMERREDAEFYMRARADLPHALALLREAVALLDAVEMDEAERAVPASPILAFWHKRRAALLAAVAEGPKEER